MRFEKRANAACNVRFSMACQVSCAGGPHNVCQRDLIFGITARTRRNDSHELLDVALGTVRRSMRSRRRAGAV